uniref:Putative rna polymerase ii transcription initiation/nucleotide excision repair factor tfiih n=1 Tax=Xenopsylla cheopis TaxID=163159 RepID=A0A6M2DRR6_XENCH
MADEEDPKEYRWESGYEKTWEAIKEDDDGLVEGSIADIIQKAKRQRQSVRVGHSRLGMMRHVYIIIDCSDSMNVQDLKPTRLLCTLKLLEIFIEEYFDQNPISHLGVIAMKNKRAEKISDLAGNSKRHLKAIQSLAKVNISGEPSLQNGLELAMKSLKMLPSHASREIIIIMGSLTTCDPNDISKTIDELKKESIRCSVISLAAEVHACRFLTQQTNGVYGAILDDSHFKDQLLAHILPPPAALGLESSLIRMGFPYGMQGDQDSKDPPLTMCLCHIDSGDNSSKLSVGGYFCPQCASKYCELPVECLACGLTLVAAPHLARSYHHLFPVSSFAEIKYEEQASNCFGCQKI